MVINKYLHRIFTLLLVLGHVMVLAQDYPADYIPPVKHPILLSGSFGELRSSHFHMGIDIKSSNGASGDAVYAVQDGFVSRIKVEAAGYGNALYIDHPDGWTTVYAHLSAFSPALEEYVRNLQYESQNFELDIAPADTLFMIKQGEQIGKMGNTGWSFGPHLHFELRNTATEVAHNPMHLGFDIPDSRPPVIKRLIAYELDPSLRARGKNGIKLKKDENLYAPYADTVTLKGELSALGFSAYDPMDRSWNKNGIYKVDAWIDDQPLFRFTLDSIDFRNSYRFETHLDYHWLATTREKAHRCYRTPADELDIYPDPLLTGLIKLYKDLSANIKILIEDFAGNESRIDLVVKQQGSDANLPVYPDIVLWDRATELKKPWLSLRFPEKSVTQDLFLYLDHGLPNEAGLIDSFFIGSYDAKPLSDFEARIPLPAADTLLAAPWTLLWESQNGSVRNLGGEIHNDSLVVQLDRFGRFYLTQDTIAPRIKARKLKPKMNPWDQIQFEITDNWEVSGDARELRYYATINGEWALFKSDLKNHRITYHFPDDMAPGYYDLRLIVRDDRDNETIFNYRFRYR